VKYLKTINQLNEESSDIIGVRDRLLDFFNRCKNSNDEIVFDPPLELIWKGSIAHEEKFECIKMYNIKINNSLTNNSKKMDFNPEGINLIIVCKHMNSGDIMKNELYNWVTEFLILIEVELEKIYPEFFEARKFGL